MSALSAKTTRWSLRLVVAQTYIYCLSTEGRESRLCLLGTPRSRCCTLLCWRRSGGAERQPRPLPARRAPVQWGHVSWSYISSLHRSCLQQQPGTFALGAPALSFAEVTCAHALGRCVSVVHVFAASVLFCSSSLVLLLWARTPCPLPGRGAYMQRGHMSWSCISSLHRSLLQQRREDAAARESVGRRRACTGKSVRSRQRRTEGSGGEVQTALPSISSV